MLEMFSVSLPPWLETCVRLGGLLCEPVHICFSVRFQGSKTSTLKLELIPGARGINSISIRFYFTDNTTATDAGIALIKQRYRARLAHNAKTQ